jgi:hypothetical protein
MTNDFDIAFFDALGDFWVNGELRLKKLPACAIALLLL